jgi:intracellular multiplication protein IcmK
MRLRSLTWVGLALTLSGPALAQQSSPQLGNTTPPTTRTDVDSAIPLTPGMIRDLLVTLKGAPKPISFMLLAGGGNYDADLSVQVAERGPNAKGPATGPAAPDTASPFLTAMLDGAPPADAEPLAVSGVSPDDLRAWKVGNRVVLRTRFALISPEWLASQTGEGGVTIYSLPITPVVLLSQDGVTVSASLSEP